MSELKTLTNEQIKNNPFVDVNKHPAFYKLIKKLYKTETHEVSQIDCTKINVAKNIQKEWFDYAEKHNIDKTDLAMGICFSGPKALDTLPDNTVEILDGCLTYKPIAETKITDRTDKPRE